jgi:adenylate cyclase class IV
MESLRRNLELKAVDPDPERSLRTCKGLGAEDRGTLLQLDTYFNVPKGRLKLRQERDAVSHLIAYERSDAAVQRESRYRIVEVPEGSHLRAALAGVLGIAAVVRKSRRLFLCDGVRIHLDSVEGLGDFIELEAVADPGDEDLRRHEARLSDLRHAFEIEGAELIGESYCDLVAGKPQSACKT